MIRWFSRNKKYLVAIFVIAQIVIIAGYMSERLDIRDFMARIVGSNVLPQKTEYILVNMNPSDIQNPYNAPHYMDNFYDLFLGRFIQNGNPDVAVSWSYLRDEVGENNEKIEVWNVRLRDGVEFHDGKMLTMNDILYSINLADDYVENLSMSTFKPVDKSTLEVRTSDRSFLSTLSSIYIVPENWSPDFFVGSGPYMVVGHQSPNSSLTELTLVPNSTYYRKVPNITKRVALSESRHRSIARAITHLKKEDSFTLYNVPLEYAPTLRQNCSVDEEYSLHPRLLMNNKVSNNLTSEVRKTLKYVIANNIEDIVKTYSGAEALTQLASPGVQGYNADINIYGNIESPSLLLEKKRLTVYTGFEDLPLAAQISNLLTPYNISFDIIPVHQDELRSSIKLKKGDLYLVQFDYRSSPSLATLFQTFEIDVDSGDDRSALEQQLSLQKASKDKGVGIGYPLFDTIYAVATCD